MSLNIPEHFEKTFINAPERICILDTAGKILWINRATENFFKSINSDFENLEPDTDYFSFLHEYLQEDEFIVHNINNKISSAIEDKLTCYTYEFPLYTVNKAYWVLLTVCCQTDQEDGKDYVIVKFYNITEHYNRRKIENKNDDNNIVRQIITESMHTWRQPLNSITLFAQDIKEQFEDNSLTNYYMNFASKQITNEIRRLSDSIDEMANFYSNTSNEDTVNIAEALFSTIEKINSVLYSSGLLVTMNCHAIADLPSENFIKITDTFRIRCGTGTRKCFHGCNKGNVVVYGDRILYNYIIRSLILLDTKGDRSKKVSFDLSVNKDKLILWVIYNFKPEKTEQKLKFLKEIFNKNFNGNFEILINENDISVKMYFKEYKTKQPI